MMVFDFGTGNDKAGNGHLSGAGVFMTWGS